MKLFFIFFLITYVGSIWADELSENLSVQSLRKEQEANRVKEDHLGRSFFPEFNFVVGEEYFKVQSIPQKSEPYGYLEARFNLFRGGKDGLLSEVMALKTSVSKMQTQLRVREELNKIRKLQFEIVSNNELISILKKEKSENSRIQLQAKRRASSGLATRTDALEFDIYASELQETIESLTHENKILKIGLSPLIGLETQGMSFPEKLNHQHDEETLARVVNFKKNPKVLSLKAENEIFQKEKSIEGRFWSPSVDLYGGHYYNYEMINKDYRERNRLDAQAVGIRITFQLSNGLQSRVEATSREYQAKAKKLMASYVERETEAKFEMLKEDLFHTHEVMHYVEDRIKKSRDYLKFTLKEYDRGVKNSLDALTAMRRYYQYEKDYLDKKREYHNIKADLLAILGE